MENEALIPYVGVVTDIRQETPDVKTFRVVGKDGKKLFHWGKHLISLYRLCRSASEIT